MKINPMGWDRMATQSGIGQANVVSSSRICDRMIEGRGRCCGGRGRRGRTSLVLGRELSQAVGARLPAVVHAEAGLGDDLRSAGGGAGHAAHSRVSGSPKSRRLSRDSVRSLFSLAGHNTALRDMSKNTERKRRFSLTESGGAHLPHHRFLTLSPGVP